MIKNKYNLPLPLIVALENDPYNFDGDISCTGLILPPRIYQLRKRHYKKIHEDASDMIYRLLGQNTHSILERVDTPGCVVEERFYAKICGWDVGGKIDLYEKLIKILSDWKVTSVWSVINGLKPEHEQQLNINAHLMRLNGTSPAKLQIVNFLRDWSKHKVKDYGYPKCQVVVQDVPLWNHEKAKSWVENRIKFHQSCGDLPDDALPFCTSQEMWEKATTYRVVKEGRKSALRVLDSQEEADQYIEDKELDKKHSVEICKGERIRCNSYCNVNVFCNQYLGL